MVLPILGAALLGAGILGNTVANRRIERSQAAIQRAQADRARRNEQLSRMALDRAVGQFDQRAGAAGAQQQEEQRQRDIYRTAVEGVAPQPVATTGSIPEAVAKVYDDMMAEQQQSGLAEAGRFGAMQAGPEWLRQAGIGLGRSAGDVDLYGDFTRSSAALVPLEMQGAVDRQRGLVNLSNLAGTLGQGALLYSMFQPAAGTQAAGGMSDVPAYLRRDPLTGRVVGSL